MSSFWHWWVVILTVANIVAMVWLIRATDRTGPQDRGPDETTGHEYDGITEYNKPMPRWWLHLFYASIIFAVVYLMLYPGLGNFQGFLGWSQEGQYEDEVDRVEARLAPIFERYAEKDLRELASDEQAMATGRRLFGNECAVCHGADGGGAPGFPNIANGVFNWGSDPEQIQQTLMSGRQGQMPAHPNLEDDEVDALIAFIFDLAGRDIPSEHQDDVAVGEALYAENGCIACHGAEGEGNPAMGATALKQGAYTWGGSAQALRQTILEGRQGQMPAFKERLGEERVRVLTAYVLHLNQGVRND